MTDLFVSGCNQPTGYFATSNSPGISIFRIDPEHSSANLLSSFGDIENPTFVIANKAADRLYASCEMPLWPEGAVTGFALSPDRKTITQLGRQSSAGSITAHLSLDRTGRFVLVTNHGWDEDLGGRDQALAIVAVNAETGVGEIAASARQTGTGPQLPRQGRSHPHAALTTADNRHVIVSDLGADALMVYRFDAETGAIALAHTIALEPGTGPRHLAFSHDGAFVHVCGELDSSITSLKVDLETGALEIVGKCRTIPADCSILNHTSEIALAPSGRHLYVANRGHDSIARIAIDPETGTPRFIDHVASGGQTPRYFACAPSGEIMAVANQDSDRVSFFAIGKDDALKPLDFHLDIGTPTCVGFLPGGS
ncbi:3-carboxymuconate cyclase [Hoeflea sp. IMCC20628]|uniref:lactonase family protein n=1 Tax=Hoeflea sp. IMCC20628 TaxID=1620421 RepID=UPI00063ABCA7|nr:lactonase family protein [Hoeflea sp. IMCC20628]AKH99241.1 3-carboxymuconate cyclase [Hoeflea sp. IMCC20628]